MSIDGFTYIFVPNALLSDLTQNLSLSLPNLPLANFSMILSQNDSASVPSELNRDDISVAGKLVHIHILGSRLRFNILLYSAIFQQWRDS